MPTAIDVVPLGSAAAVRTATIEAGSGAVPTSMRYTTFELPMMRPLRSLKTGVTVVMLPTGSSGTGASNTTGSTTLKLAGSE